MKYLRTLKGVLLAAVIAPAGDMVMLVSEPGPGYWDSDRDECEVLLGAHGATPPPSSGPYHERMPGAQGERKWGTIGRDGFHTH